MSLPLFLGLGMGVKGILDSAGERRRKLAQASSDAAAMRFSPWSGINVSHLVGKDYSSQDPLSGALAGGLSGVNTALNIQNAIEDNKLRQAKADYYKSRLPAAKVTPYTDLGMDVSDEDLLKGYALRGMPYGGGVGDV